MRSNSNAVEVLIIGGGPVGLASAIQLGRAGIRTLLLERRPSFSRHSKAAGVHARTMEIYRQWGLADQVREAGGGGGGVFTAGWMTRLAGIELGTITVGANPEELELFRSWSPELMCLCGQDVYEPILAEAARRFPSVQIRLDCESYAISQDEEGVTVEFASGPDAKERVRAQYVIAADGVRSPTRKALDIAEDALPSFGNSINVLFEGALEPYRNGRRYGLFWVVNGDTQGALSWKRRADLWSYNFEAADGEDPASYTPERCAELIRLATGVPDLDVKIVSILHWQHDQSVTTQWRKGRVFLAGDASHRFPPHGGFGMNSGVQDSQNLAWKLIARLRWAAGDGLLDSYEQERLPVARFNGEQCLVNTRRMAETGWLLKDTRALAAIETAEGAALRQKISDAIPKQREQFFSQGQQFGQIYESSAVVDDDSAPEPSTVSDYRPTGRPGARSPHIWLEDEAGRSYSSIDLYDGGFKLLSAADSGRWAKATEQAAQSTGVPVTVLRVGAPGSVQRSGDPDWRATYGIEADGAVLIRPDGHVGARWARMVPDPEVAIRSALGHILDAEFDRAGARPAAAALAPA